MNKKTKITGLLAITALMMLLLQGCGSQSDSAAAAGTTTETSTSSSAAAADNSSSASTDPQSGTAAAAVDSSAKMGKIESISDSTIKVYESEMPAGMQGGGGPDGSNGTPPSGAPEDNGQPAAASADASGQAAPASGDPSGQKGMGGGGQRGQMFSDETTDITVTSSTKYTKVTFDNGERTETDAALSDLKAGDIITYVLTDGTTTAESIQISSGMQQGGRGGQGRDGQAADGSGSSTDSTQSGTTDGN
ncbi:hypothetical protein [Paenibacillus pinistramenti]|uniref:hypothetical protein n=1 Tax=Paenibacillus pinistramenti TaxID=1768003 RepID=UPI001108CD9B|nr:hypothetical protein [Paenibacillus pinistramenti]